MLLHRYQWWKCCYVFDEPQVVGPVAECLDRNRLEASFERSQRIPQGEMALPKLSTTDNLFHDDTRQRPGLGHAVRPSRRDAVRGRCGALGEVRRRADRGDAGTATRPPLFADAARAGRSQAGGIRQCAHGERAARPRRGTPGGRDHRHRLRTIRPYEYENAATLLEDFWTEVDQVLRERGSIP